MLANDFEFPTINYAMCIKTAMYSHLKNEYYHIAEST